MTVYCVELSRQVTQTTYAYIEAACEFEARLKAEYLDTDDLSWDFYDCDDPDIDRVEPQDDRHGWNYGLEEPLDGWEAELSRHAQTCPDHDPAEQPYIPPKEQLALPLEA